MTDSIDIVARLRKTCGLDAKLHNQAADEIKRLRQENATLTAERDEARREVCELLYNRQGGWPKEHANERGWDCFEHSDSVQNLTPEADSAYTP